MKTHTIYTILNAKGTIVALYDNEAQATEKLNKGLKRGWNWTLETTVRTIRTPEIWEMAGCKQDTTKVDWGKNWMLQ